MTLRTGIDLIEIQRFEDLNPVIRERFLKRVFTETELRDARGQWASLAGKFAAKEAVAKALGCGIGPVAWKEIEVRQGLHGEPVLELHGAARQISNQIGLQEWSISISHTRTHATAMAVAIGVTAHPR